MTWCWRRPWARIAKGAAKRIVRVLVPKTSQIVGRFFMDAGTGFVVPDDSRLSFDILIPADSVSGARMGFMVVVELTRRPTRRTKAVGKIVEILGDKMGTSMAVDIALRTHGSPYTAAAGGKAGGRSQ